MITREELAGRFMNACDEVIAGEDIFTDIDSRFGDADHGLTMTKIAKAIKGAVAEADGSIQEMIDDAAMAVMDINGGSAPPLWNTWLDGMQEEAPDSEEAELDEIKAMFANAFTEFADMSGAEVGDKTIMDALSPASDAIAGYDGDIDGLFAAAAKAAADGAEKSREFTAKFGRAKSYGDKTIGTPDAGALSISYFFKGLAK